MDFISFSWVDYTLFVLMFGLSSIVGLYFGCYKKQDTAADYLHGGKNMKVFPVSMSLVASTLSGISLLGIPTEVYMHGTQYWAIILSIFVVAFIANHIFLPVFYKLQLISIYEYLELRFDKRVRTTASALFTIYNLVHLPVLIYAPALAFSYVTDTNLHLIALTISLICIFYTTIGGAKAVIWADTLQFSMTLCTLVCVLVVGTISVGGVSAVWEKSQLGNRIEFFNMNPDPTLRGTFWSVLLGSFFFWLFSVGVHPSTVQRFLSVPTFDDSERLLVIFVIVTIITKSIGCFTGLIIYAKYYNCDPFSAGQITKPDQILPYYILDIAADLPGVSGLFIAGLCTTTFSTLSTYLNTLSGTMYKDFIAPFMPADTSERTISTIMKILTALIGIVSIALVFVAEKLGTLLQMTISLVGITLGPLLGIFTMGVLFPTANKKGAFYGLMGGISFILFVAIKAQIYVLNGRVRFIPKPLHTYGCNTSSVTEISVMSSNRTSYGNSSSEEPYWLFRISFYYYMLVGTLSTLIIGLPISWLTRDSENALKNPDLFSPCVHRFLVKSAAATRYKSVEKFELNEYN